MFWALPCATRRRPCEAALSQQINLYNPLFLKQERYFSARAMAQALGIIALGVAALCTFAFVQTQAAERSAQQQEERLAKQRDQLGQLAARLASQGKSKALEAELVRLEGEVKARQSTLRALATGEMGNTTGFSEFLAAFGRQALAGVWLRTLVLGESGDEMFVQARALRAELVPAYLRGLGREEMMKGRRVTELKLAAKSLPDAPAARAEASAAVAEPAQFIEFAFSAPLRAAEPPLAKGPGR